MVARLREKPGGDRIAVTMGDFADVAVEGRYRLIYVVFNSLFNLLTQDEQVRCFENVAAHLTDDGVFVVEAFTPGYLHRLRDDQYVDAEEIRRRQGLARRRPPRPGRAAARQEPRRRSPPPASALNPVVLRYAWPSELDLMARIAGLRLHDRVGRVGAAAVHRDSRLHVSVWGR